MNHFLRFFPKLTPQFANYSYKDTASLIFSPFSTTGRSKESKYGAYRSRSESYRKVNSQRKIKLQHKDKDLGKKFEDVVASLFESYGFKVKRNLRVVSSSFSAELDLVVVGNYDWLVVECKYRNPKSEIKLEEVAKFCSVVESLAIPFEKAVMVSNVPYSKRAIHYAAKKGITLHTFYSLKNTLG